MADVVVEPEVLKSITLIIVINLASESTAPSGHTNMFGIRQSFTELRFRLVLGLWSSGGTLCLKYRRLTVGKFL